ncbi:hypothetical protein [Kribbella sp. NPDC051718]|uniref:hypothetical protein n=1 Tax=Kribbella sp. NPDC051718 TaxID=3155168 RepID=UPI00344565D8
MLARPLLSTTVAICATLTLASCNNSPEAGHPNTAPTTSTTPTPTPTAPSTPAYTPEEQAAITAATAQYIAARAATDRAFETPAKFDRNALAKAGNSGQWLVELSGGAKQLKEYGWYQTGKTKISGTTVVSVNLGLEQPEVRLTNCIDSSGVVTRFVKDNKPVPVGPDNGKRHQFSSQLVFAKPASGGQQMWFLIADKVGGAC